MIVQLLENKKYDTLLRMYGREVMYRFTLPFVDAGSREANAARIISLITMVKPSLNIPEMIENLNGEGDITDEEELYAKYVDVIFAAYWSVANNADPTPNNKYATWIVKQYIARSNEGIQRLEDMDRVNIALSFHNDMVNRRRFQNSDDPNFTKLSDINKFTSLVELETFVRRVKNGNLDANEWTKRFIKNMERFHSSGDVDIFYQSEDKMKYAIELKSVEASTALFAQKTSWCTAPEGNIYFDDYLKEGPLYCLIDLKRSEFIQIHSESRQCMDKDDVPVDLNEFPLIELLGELITRIADGIEPKLWLFVHFPEDEYGLFGAIDEATLDEEDKRKIINAYPHTINDFHMVSDALKLEAIKLDISVIFNMHMPTKRMCELAWERIKKLPPNKEYIRRMVSNPTIPNHISDDFWDHVLKDGTAVRMMMNSYSDFLSIPDHIIEKAVYMVPHYIMNMLNGVIPDRAKDIARKELIKILNGEREPENPSGLEGDPIFLRKLIKKIS